MGVKIRTRTSAGPPAGSTNTVSLSCSSRASRCISHVVQPAGVGEDRELVSGQRDRGEHVEQHVREPADRSLSGRDGSGRSQRVEPPQRFDRCGGVGGRPGTGPRRVAHEEASRSTTPPSSTSTRAARKPPGKLDGDLGEPFLAGLRCLLELDLRVVQVQDRVTGFVDRDPEDGAPAGGGRGGVGDGHA